MPLKVVFDTNIFISAIIFGGNPRKCLELARNKEIVVYTSQKLLLELANKLHHKFKWENEDIQDLIIGISKFVNIILPKKEIDKIKKDPADNRVLETAQEIDEDYIISGDSKHILPLRKFGKTRITTAANFLHLFLSRKSE